MADLTKTLNDGFSSGSSSGFEGWLLKFGSREFPMECIAEEGYSCTPNQRQEVEAWQDNRGNLHRDTASHYRTKIEITTMDELTREDIQNIQSDIKSLNTRMDSLEFQIKSTERVLRNQSTKSETLILGEVERVHLILDQHIHNQTIHTALA